MRNFSENANPATPEYWLAQGAFTMDADAEGAREEPHRGTSPPTCHTCGSPSRSRRWLRVTVGKAVLSDINPLFLAPAEAFGFGKKMYTGAPIEENYSEPSRAMTPMLPLLALLGGTERGYERESTGR